MSAVDECYKTWKCTATHLAELRNEFDNGASGFAPIFEAAEKAFCHSIIETIASAAHTTHKSVYFQKLPVLPAGIECSGYRSRQTSGRIRFEFCHT